MEKYFLPKNKSKSEIIILKDEYDEEIDQKYTSKYINDFFTSIGPKLAEKHQEKWKYFGTELENSIEDLKVNEGIIFDLVRDIDIYKSSGLEKISSTCLKDALLVLISQLGHIFEKSIQNGIFPDEWKIATIIPIFKNGDKGNVSNYRPVSLLPIPGKILEKLFHYHLTNFLEQNKFLSEKQNGFRKNCSTLNSIVNLTNDVFESINNGEYTIAAFIDLKKAFDTVNHKILLKKLYYAGIRNNTWKWIENYLHNRVQKTFCNGIKSENGYVTFGVPQGSILGPLFFLIYINDIQNVLDNNSYQLYADNTVIYCSNKSKDLAENKLQNLIEKFSKWCSQNALTINIKKTKVMAFGTRSKIN